MLKFINKDGKEVMELKDNGNIVIEDAKLKQELALQEGVVNKKKEDNEEKK